MIKKDYSIKKGSVVRIPSHPKILMTVEKVDYNIDKAEVVWFNIFTLMKACVGVGALKLVRN